MSGIPAGAGQLLGKRLGKFEILALLALGGTAEIYLARIGGAAGFEKYVVVKCLHDHLADDAEFVKMFLDEARLAAHLDHSNIVQTMELGQHEGRYYMVMEFLAGLSLAMIVRRAAERMQDTRIPVPLVLNILAQSCACAQRVLTARALVGARPVRKCGEHGAELVVADREDADVHPRCGAAVRAGLIWSGCGRGTCIPSARLLGRCQDELRGVDAVAGPDLRAIRVGQARETDRGAPLLVGGGDRLALPETPVKSDREAARCIVEERAAHADDAIDASQQRRGLRLAIAGIEDHQLDRRTGGGERGFERLGRDELRLAIEPLKEQAGLRSTVDRAVLDDDIPVWPRGGARVGVRSMPRAPWPDAPRALAAALPEPTGSSGTERTSAGFGRAEACERVAVRRQHLGFRSPLSYFHNGFAADLDAVVDFYNTRFNIGFTKQEKSDLVAFLRSL